MKRHEDNSKKLAKDNRAIYTKPALTRSGNLKNLTAGVGSPT